MQPLTRDNIRLAATVMLIRDTAGGVQVYMVKRPGRGDFPDLHVFPGGKVDEGDFAPDIADGLTDREASEQLGISAGGLRYWVAVVRECFEECGVLIANRQGAPLEIDSPGEYAAWRAALLSGELPFAEFCVQQQLHIDCTRLGYFSHWLTPEMAPRRFDTRFFLAAMPANQKTTADTDETAGEQWIAPARAMQLQQQGEWQMIDPTLRSLETLCQYQTVEEALAAVKTGNHLMPLTPELNRQGMQSLR